MFHPSDSSTTLADRLRFAIGSRLEVYLITKSDDRLTTSVPMIPTNPTGGGAIPAGSAPRSPGKSGFLGRPAIPMVPEANNKCNWRPLFGAQKSYRNFWFTEIQRDVNVFA